jgi:HK97 family phage portal protein
MPKPRKAAFRAATATPILRQNSQAGDQPLAVRSMRTWFDVWERNGDVSRATEVLGDTVAKSGVLVMKGEREFKSPETDALVKSFLSVKGDAVVDVKVGGNVFWAILRNAEGNPVGVELLDPCHVTIYTDSATSLPTRYVYADQMRQGRQFTYPAEDVIHVKPAKDRKNPAWGISPVARVVYDAFGDDRAAMANFVFFDNNAVPAHLVKLVAGATQEQADKLREQMEAKYGGAKNQGKVGTLSNAIDSIITLTATDKDGKWVGMRQFSTEKVCAAMGVPKSILNYTEGVNYANGAQQYQIFIENTVRPMEERFEQVLNTLLSPYGCTADIIDDHISQAMQWADIAVKLKSGGIITTNEARDYVGHEPDESLNDPAEPSQPQA